MSLTKKDQLLLTVLLPLLIGAAYVFLWSRPVRRETARLQTRLQTLGDEASILMRRDQLNAEQARLRRRLSETEAQSAPREEPQPPPPAEAPAASLRRLQDLLHRSGVRLVSATVDTPRDAAAAGTDAGVADILRKTGSPHPKTWDVTVEASYAALLRLLDDCATSPLPVVPLTLQMDCATSPLPVVPLTLQMRPGLGDNPMTFWTLRVCL